MAVLDPTIYDDTPEKKKRRMAAVIAIGKKPAPGADYSALKDVALQPFTPKSSLTKVTNFIKDDPDRAPLIARRKKALQTRRGLPSSAKELGQAIKEGYDTTFGEAKEAVLGAVDPILDSAEKVAEGVGFEKFPGVVKAVDRDPITRDLTTDVGSERERFNAKMGQEVATTPNSKSSFVRTPTGRVHVENQPFIDPDLMQIAKANIKARGPDIQRDFTEADKEKFAVPEGSFARSNPSGEGSFSTTPGWTAADQAQLDKLRGEGYGSGRIAKEKEQARIARLTPNTTSPFERRTALRNAQVGMEDIARRGESKSDNRSRLRTNAVRQSEIARLEDQFAAEDTAMSAFQGQQGQQGAEATTTDPLDVARFELDRMKVREAQKQNTLNQQMEEAKLKQKREADLPAQVKNAIEISGIPYATQGLVSSLALQPGQNPLAIAGEINRILLSEPNTREALESEKTTPEKRAQALEDLRGKLGL